MFIWLTTDRCCGISHSVFVCCANLSCISPGNANSDCAFFVLANPLPHDGKFNKIFGANFHWKHAEVPLPNSTDVLEQVFIRLKRVALVFQFLEDRLRRQHVCSSCLLDVPKWLQGLTSCRFFALLRTIPCTSS